MGYFHFSPSLGTMARCTTPENCPFGHWNTDAVKPMAPISLSGYPKLLKNSYMGIELRPETVAPAMNQLKSGMTPDLFERIVRQKAERDGLDKYHMTVISPREYRELMNDGREIAIPEAGFDFSLLGVGTASNSKTQAWYGVAQSPVIQRWRRELQLPVHDLHVTLGFTGTDIHGVVKDSTTLVKAR